jgi:hypothetical protein
LIGVENVTVGLADQGRGLFSLLSFEEVRQSMPGMAEYGRLRYSSLAATAAVTLTSFADEGRTCFSFCSNNMTGFPTTLIQSNDIIPKEVFKRPAKSTPEALLQQGIGLENVVTSLPDKTFLCEDK